MQRRPTEKELIKRLKEAKEHLKKHDGVFANPAKVVGELNELDILDSKEIWPLILTLLEEISPKDYQGGRPPQKSYEKTTTGHELFAFCWWSNKMQKRMYVKFVLKNERYHYISLHKSRFEE